MPVSEKSGFDVLSFQFLGRLGLALTWVSSLGVILLATLLLKSDGYGDSFNGLEIAKLASPHSLNSFFFFFHSLLEYLHVPLSQSI